MSELQTKKSNLKMCALAVAVSVGASAVVEASDLILEEIVITARKRVENLQDVPVSVLAYQGDELKSAGIVDLQALSISTPNFYYAQATGASDILIVRGLGTSGSGPHFEPAVGQVINGQFISRSRLGRSAFLDISQVEILKGPQGAIIGKNTSLGAINVMPNKPTDDFAASVTASYEFEAREGALVEGFVSGPLSETVRARLALSYRDQDKLVENGEGAPDAVEEDLAGRFIIDWAPTDDFEAELFTQFAEFDRNGVDRELTFCNDPEAVLAALGDDCTLNGKTTSEGYPAGFNPNTGHGSDAGTPFELSANVSGLTLSYDFGNVIFTSLTGYQDSDITNTIDTDLSARQTQAISNREEFEQISQEFRLSSGEDSSFNWIVGMFYLDNEMDFEQLSDFSAFFGRNLRRQQLGEVDTSSYSVFGQVDYEFTDQWAITVGARYTDESRDGFALQTNFSPAYSFDNPGGSCNVPGPGAGFRFCNEADESFDSEDVSYNLSLQYRLSDNSMLYATAATGFKSGAFNLLSGQRQDVLDDSFVFDDEESLNLEVGGKHTLLNGGFRFNWALFETTVDDLQVSQNVPEVIAQVINNAGQASVVGIEFDGGWAVSDAFTLNYSGALIEAEYDDFEGAGCYTGQTLEEGCVGGTTNGVQDLSGERTTRAPELQLAVDASYVFFDVIDNFDLTFKAKVNYLDDYQVNVDNDPEGAQDSTTKIDAAITLARSDNRWWVSLVGRNLTDEETMSFAAGTNAVNAPSLGGGGRFAVLDETRAVSLKAQYTF